VKDQAEQSDQTGWSDRTAQIGVLIEAVAFDVELCKRLFENPSR
jgi:hypothetical protein